MGVVFSGFYINLMLAVALLLAFWIPNQVTAHTRGTDAYAYFDAYLAAGTYCAPQTPITAWTITSDRYVEAGSTTFNNNNQLSGGVFTTRVAGVYHCCASFRGRQGGFHDWTIGRTGVGASETQVCAFGTRITGNNGNEWDSHGCCVTTRSQAGVTYRVNYWSGNSATDCIEETGWRYAKFTCFLTNPN